MAVLTWLRDKQLQRHNCNCPDFGLPVTVDAAAAAAAAGQLLTAIRCPFSMSYVQTLLPRW